MTEPSLDLTALIARADPPQAVIEAAIQMSTFSPCRSKRGAVVFASGVDAVHILGRGYNHKSKFECDGSADCKRTCRIEAIHAEQMALINAAKTGYRVGMEALHVKTVDGHLVASSGPSCVQCSKILRASGVHAVWLYHGNGWNRYTMDEFHRLSVEAERDALTAAEARCRAVEQERDDWQARATMIHDDKWEVLLKRAEAAEQALAEAERRAFEAGWNTGELYT